MANTIDWGQAAVNNTNGFGKSATNNTIDFGEVCADSWSPETNLTGTGATPSFENEYSFQFDGIDDYVTMGNVLNMADDGTDAFSLSCWFKTTSTATQMIIAKQTNASPYNGYNLYMSANRFKFHLGTTASSAVIQGQTGLNGSITDGNWHHLTLTYDGSQDISGFNLYYDGVNTTIFAIANNTPSNISNTADFNISGRGSGALVFNGTIDEASYFNTELSSSDVTSIYNSGVPNDISSLSPVGWWRMGENGTWNGSKWLLTDQGSGGNDGNGLNMAEANRTTDIPTFSKLSTLFDGIDDRVECSSLTAYDNSDFSVSIWVKKTTSGLEYVISNSSSSSKAGFDIIINSLNVNFQRRTTTKQASTGYINIGFTYNTWHNLIGTYNDTTGDLKLYLDGVLKNTSTASVDVNSASLDLKIGCSTGNGLFFQGGIDEVSLFNSELLQSDIATIYNSGVPNDISSLSPLSWWRCGDNDTSPTLTDNGSGGNNGTMTNFTTFSTDVPT